MTATPSWDRAKYSERGNCTSEMFKNYDLDLSVKETLAGIANLGLARSTWSTYRTAERMLATCRKKQGRRLELPLTEEDILVFIHWLIQDRKAKAGTIKSYLAGVRQLHISKGMPPPVIHTNLVQLLLTGKTNGENIEKRRTGGHGRAPITLNIMRLLKEAIRTWAAPMSRKLLMWAVCTMAFHGAFRIHELLVNTESSFCPDFALLEEHVREKQLASGHRALEVVLKCPKENKTAAPVIVEIFETKGKLCPVKAFTRWRGRTKAMPGYPCFREDDGTPLTGRKFNNWLQDRLANFATKTGKKFSTHSFRIGLATSMAALGISEDDIKEAGRWSSRAYECYIRLPRKKRRTAATCISKLDEAY